MTENTSLHARFTRSLNTCLTRDSAIMPRVVNPLPMPTGAAVPARSSYTPQIPPAEPAQPAASQTR